MDCLNGGQWEGSRVQSERGAIACLDPGGLGRVGTMQQVLTQPQSYVKPTRHGNGRILPPVSIRAKWSNFPREEGERGRGGRERLETEAKVTNHEFCQTKSGLRTFSDFYLQTPFGMALTMME